MQLYAWLTYVNRNYGPGTIAVAAPDVDAARSLIFADFDRWVRTGCDEGAPFVSGMFDPSTEDGYSEWMTDWEKEESDAEIAAHREQLETDLAKDPMVLPPSGILYISGSE